MVLDHVEVAKDRTQVKTERQTFSISVASEKKRFKIVYKCLHRVL